MYVRGADGEVCRHDEVPNHDLAQRMAELARAVAAPRSVEDVLSDVTAEAKKLIPGVDAAGILLIGKAGKWDIAGGHLGSAASARRTPDAAPARGRVVQAALDDLIVRTDDFRDRAALAPSTPRRRRDRRAERPVVQAVHELADRGRAEPVRVRDRTPSTREAETIGAVLAAHAAAAILASRQSEQLESALSTRDRIGQAKGIIMERYDVDDVAAFEMLRKLSQDSNTTLDRRRGTGDRDQGHLSPT